MTGPKAPAAADPFAGVRAYAESLRADAHHSHQPGRGVGGASSCYCDLPMPCEDLAAELARIDGIDALLDDNGRLRAQLHGFTDDLGILDDGKAKPRILDPALRGQFLRLRAAGIFGPEYCRPAKLMTRKAGPWTEIPATEDGT